MSTTDRSRVCGITSVRLPRSRLVPLELLGGQVGEKIRKDYPNLKLDAMIDRDVVSRYRTERVEELLRLERGDLTNLDRQVAQSLASGTLVSQQLRLNKRSFGESASDALAVFGGSWAFLLMFVGCMGLWILLNREAQSTFDAYPFILLNLVLSCLADVQAPIIMMSQHRPEIGSAPRTTIVSISRQYSKSVTFMARLTKCCPSSRSAPTEIQQLQIETMQDRGQ